MYRQSHDPPSRRHVPWLVGRFLPYYLRHVGWRPYRRTAAGVRGARVTHTFRSRHRTAIYDAVLEIMLRGYADVAGHRLRVEAGQAAVLFMRLGFAFDDEYERREATNESLDFAEIFDSAAMRDCLAPWRSFMGGVDTYDAIRSFLDEFSEALYRDYVGDPVGERPLDTVLRRARIDSGGLLVALVHVMARLHATTPSDTALAQFSSLGVTAKLADDMTDAQLDYAGARANLVLTIAAEEPAEHERVLAGLAGERRMGVRWWRRRCPHTYGRLVQLYREHESGLTSPWLRFASRLMWLPVVTGHTTTIEVRGRT